ncbi:hypothetical protein [Bradyrhizobium cenepequi]
MSVPSLFSVRDDRPSRALLVLQQSAKPEGTSPFAAPKSAVHFNVGISDLTGRMALAGWMEERRSGPRGGRRFHATELGRGVLKIIDEFGPRYREHLWIAYPEMLAQNKSRLKLSGDP